MPQVSVILPNYNHAPYLKQRIESILNQTLQDFELILLDDASIDDSLQILNQYTNHPKVTFYKFNDQNSGSTFHQWQKGLEMAKGKFIWIAESDDFAEINFLEKCIETFTDNEDLGICYSASNWVNSKNEIIHVPSHENESLGTLNGNRLIMNEFAKGCLIYNASAAVFKKELVQKVDFGRLVTFKLCGDWFFWIQILQNSKLIRLPLRLNNFRQHSNSVSTLANKIGLQFTEGAKIKNYIQDNFKIPFWQKRKIEMLWALKIKLNQVIESNKALSNFNFEVKFWYYLLKMFNIKRF